MPLPRRPPRSNPRAGLRDGHRGRRAAGHATLLSRPGPSRPRPVAGPLLAALAALPGTTVTPAAAQQWNGPRALELVERARAQRHEVRVDSALRSYKAEAQGFVYFFLDRTDTGEATLIKTDQVALEVYWQAPNRTRQRIVGLRDQKELPTNIKYHLDHLTVVQDEFADRIRLGDGDEVADVTHPVAPDAEATYDYRLRDSLTISFPGGGDEVRVYEVQVRPKDLDRPGFVGAIFLDRTTAAIVRMSFTFTPASYVDPYLDYIRISLDNSLWMGRYWLPYRQEAELRRELPALDFLAGSVIRGRFEIRGYQLNPDLPARLFAGSRVSAVPEEQRRAYPFADSLHADLDEEGLARPPSLTEVRERAREMVQDRALSGLRRLRLHLPSASSAYRYGRAEGSFAGLGTTLRPSGDLAVQLHGGYAFGREKPSASLRLFRGDPDTGIRAEAWWHRPDDVGPVAGSSGVLNTLAALTRDTDWTDPYFTSGAALALGSGEPVPWLLGARPTAILRWSRHRSAADVVSDTEDGFRPVRPVTEGERTELETRLAWGRGSSPDEGWGAEVRHSASLPGVSDLSGSRTFLTLAWSRSGGWRDLELSTRLDAGLAGGDAPPQLFFLLGGRETILGHPFRGFVGDRFWLLRGRAERSVVDPWLSLRAFASAGQAGGLRSTELPDGWKDLDRGGRLLFGLGAGVGLLWDVLRLDVGRGLDGGEWDAAFSITHRFRRWL